MNQAALVGVIVSVYNGAAYLAQTLDSILGQSFPHFTLFVVDDASTDATPAIIADYTRKDSRIRSITNGQNRGIAASHNVAMALCDAPYIAPMGADDLVTADWLEKKYAAIEAQPTIAVLGSAMQTIGQDGSPMGTVWAPAQRPQALRNALFTSGTGMPHGSSLIRTEVLKQLGGYRENFVAALDVDLWLRIAERYDMACMPDILMYYRQHDASISHQKAATQAYNHTLAMISSEYRRQGKPDPIAGKELTGELMYTLLRSGTPSALTWFNLLSQRAVPDKEKHLHKACIMAYERPCDADFLRRQLPVWRYFASHYQQSVEGILAAAQRGTSAQWKANVRRVHTGATLLADYARNLNVQAQTPEVAEQLAAYAHNLVQRMLEAE